MVEPIVPAQEVLERDADFHLAAVVQHLYYQVLVVEVETGPDLSH